MREVGAAWKRRDKFKRSYIYVQLQVNGKKVVLYLFPNPTRNADHQPHFRVVDANDRD